MSDTLDAYHTWLGIPPSEQPPNAYRLLGLRPFESNAEVIQNAVDRQTIHLRTYQLGEYSELSQRLLNEVAAARLTLLDADKKAQYDRQLAAELAPAAPGPVAPASSGEPALLGVPRPPGASPLRPVARRRRRRLSALLYSVAATVVLLVALVYVFSMVSSGGGPSSPRAGAAGPSRAESPPDAQHPLGPTPTAVAPQPQKPEPSPAEPPRTTVIVSQAHRPAAPAPRSQAKPKSSDRPAIVKPSGSASPAPRKQEGENAARGPSAGELHIELPSGATVSTNLLRDDVAQVLQEYERSVRQRDASLVALSRHNGRPLALARHDGGVLDGSAMLLYPTGQVKMLAHYVHGDREGWLQSWDDRKQKRLWCRYIRGKRSGLGLWFEDGALRLVVEYRLDGPVAYHRIDQGRIAASYDDPKAAAQDKETAQLLADLEKFDEELATQQRELKQLVRRQHREWRRHQAARAKPKGPTGVDAWAKEQREKQRELIRTVKRQSKF